MKGEKSMSAPAFPRSVFVSMGEAAEGLAAAVGNRNRPLMSQGKDGPLPEDAILGLA
jgi:hypothetical protein